MFLHTIKHNLKLLIGLGIPQLQLVIILTILKAVVALYPALVTPALLNTPVKISNDPRFFPYFKRNMRPLDEKETTAVFEKLFKFTGSKLKHIVERPSLEGPDEKPGRYCFRLQKNKVYYVSDSLVKRATNISRGKLIGLGTCIGKFTKGGSFHLTIQCLDLLAAHAKHKIWLKPASEMSFLYGNHVLKGGLGRITENISPSEGVVIFSMSDIPLGFGIAAKSTQDCRKLDPNAIVALHQADIGGYLRMEDDL